jgi:predicted nucleic acid-binding protein
VYLVDTSVWVDYIRGTGSPAGRFLDELLAIPSSTGINDQIYLEILQGARDEAAFKKFQRYFSTQRFYEFSNSRRSYEAAAALYFNARKKGITIRSSIDCLIAQCAFEHGLVLLHQDYDFIKLAQVIPKLEQQHFLVD